MADDIPYILVVKTDSKIYHSNSESELAQQIEQQPNRLKIKTASEIETAIDYTQIDWGGEYSAAFYYKKSRDVDIKSFSGEHVPGFILMKDNVNISL
jgi:ABC-2 type transport system permease protein